MDALTSQQVSVLFHNNLSQAVSHAILFENEDAFQQLMGGKFKTTREGKDVFLQISTISELFNIRQITKIPLFMTF